MATHHPQTQPSRPKRVTALTGDSWLSLVAAATKGIGQLGRLRVRVKSVAPLPGNVFRLVVQSYARADVRPNGLPYPASTPVASLQRAVSQEDLTSGLELDVMHVGASHRDLDDLVVFAWVEPGRPDFKYEAALARPSLGALQGYAVSRYSRGDSRVAELLLTAA